MDLRVVSAVQRDVEQAINRLRSLHDGDIGVVETIGCGPRVIPTLRALLFEREPSGLFESRCRAVQALAALDARDVLLEFLSLPHEAADPVERLGDDAVVNAAARATVKYRDEQIFQLMRHLARQRLRPGVITALGSFCRPEAIPSLIDALAEDECRLAAEAALEQLGPAAHRALMRAATQAINSPEDESPSRQRQRRSAHDLLKKMGISTAGAVKT